MCILDLFRLQMEVKVKKKKNEGFHLRRNKILSVKNAGITKLSAIGKLTRRKKCRKCKPRPQLACMNPSCDLESSEWGGKISPYSSVKTQSTQFTDVCKELCSCKKDNKCCDDDNNSNKLDTQDNVKIANFIDIDSEENLGNTNLGFEGDNKPPCNGSINRCSFLNKYRKRLQEIQEEEARLNAKNNANSLKKTKNVERVITAKDATQMPDPER
ncbi:uncharacterized protein LOC121875924 [Homarus americanus]|uniref:uncharacterized protein LOC121875924 n=1 Tax=Homarus americanus TaxID=6706 RepID=UPI001C45B0E2|nr:uncharacterized protein LOC121875924 [Homarus americanus]